MSGDPTTWKKKELEEARHEHIDLLHLAMNICVDGKYNLGTSATSKNGQLDECCFQAQFSPCDHFKPWVRADLASYLGIGCAIKSKKLDSIFELGYHQKDSFSGKASFMYPLNETVMLGAKVDTSKETYETACAIKLDKHWAI